jgi:hypothetical protein
LCGFHENGDDGVLSKIWKIKAPECIHSFIWIICHDHLITNFRKSKVSLGTFWCNHCVNVIETTLDVLCDCPLAKFVWECSLEGCDVP